MPPRQPHAFVKKYDAKPEEDEMTNYETENRKFEMLTTTLIALTLTNRNIASYVPRERVMYARSLQKMARSPVIGGEPITQEMAMALRCVVFGTCTTPSRGEWLRTGIAFRDAGKESAFGLKAPRNGARGMLSALQAFIIKHLLFEKHSEKILLPEECLKPDKELQLEVLAMALSDILWKIGEKKKSVVCLPQENSYVQHSLTYFQDTITEKLHIFELINEDELRIFIKRYLYLFQDEPGQGALLFLYSAVLTRGIDTIEKDLTDDKGCLIVSAEEGIQCIVMLILTGRATSFLHNGVIYVGDEHHYAIPHYGVLSRSEIGFLFYEDGMTEHVPGSRLKTPSLPIWVVYSQGHYGVIFNTNRELLRNYHAERRFELTYYTCGGSQCQLIVDTRNNQSNISRIEDNSSTFMTNLENVIHTKWADAHIQWMSTTIGV